MYESIKKVDYAPVKSTEVDLDRFIWAMESVTSRAFQGFGVDMEKLSSTINTSLIGLGTLAIIIAGYASRLLDETTTVMNEQCFTTF